MSRRVLYPDSTRSITVYERYVCQIPVNEYLPHQKDLKTKIPLEDAMKIELRIERTDKLREAYLNRKLLSQASAVHFPLNRAPSTVWFSRYCYSFYLSGTVSGEISS